MLLADRGDDADWIRTLVRQHGARANIHRKEIGQGCYISAHIFNKARNLVERFFNKINHCRRVVHVLNRPMRRGGHEDGNWGRDRRSASFRQASPM